MKIAHCAEYESKCKPKCFIYQYTSSSMPCVNVLMPNIVATLIIQLLTNNVRK